ncbi:virulence factor TspB C-terminal domain-related protein [Chromobacterium haemolyticum]|uniref:virulence factor TspB C-terminal domain-related protein n=1 Tax=Chromobacterium haemolyticum TaxID=394935 RepID=UPI0011B1F0A8|nr:virulence factor TspB C-terminal domain-related protein [Chromobacterium haemolyticum]
MWRVILSLLLFLGLSGFYLPEANAETIPAVQRPGLKGDCLKALKALSAGEVVRAETTDNACVGYNVHGSLWGAYSFASLGWNDVWGCPDASWTYDAFANKCSRPDKPNPTDCPSPDVMAITCSALAGKYQQKGMITPTMGPGCDTGGGNSQMQQCGAGCGMTTRQVVTPTAAYLAHVYTGAYCKPDGSVTDGSYVKTPPTNKVCPEGQVYGEVNDVPTCLNSRQEPGKQAPETTSPDSCPKGSVSLINVTTGKPMGCVDPADSSKPCPDGTYKVTQGGMTTCQGTATTPAPSSPPGSGGSSGHPGGPKPGTGGSTGGAGGTNPKPGDSSSPTPEKPSDKPCDEQFPAGLKWVCGLGDGLKGPDGNQGPTTENGGDISGMLDTSDFFGGGTCPAPYVLSVPISSWVWQWNITYEPLCNFVLLLRPGIIACAFIAALYIIFANRS